MDIYSPSSSSLAIGANDDVEVGIVALFCFWVAAVMATARGAGSGVRFPESGMTGRLKRDPLCGCGLANLWDDLGDALYWSITNSSSGGRTLFGVKSLWKYRMCGPWKLAIWRTGKCMLANGQYWPFEHQFQSQKLWIIQFWDDFVKWQTQKWISYFLQLLGKSRR